MRSEQASMRISLEVNVDQKYHDGSGIEHSRVVTGLSGTQPSTIYAIFTYTYFPFLEKFWFSRRSAIKKKKKKQVFLLCMRNKIRLTSPTFYCEPEYATVSRFNVYVVTIKQSLKY